MSKANLLLLVLLFSIYLISCTESKTTAIEPEVISDYSADLEKLFPINIGNTFIYNIDTLNLITNNYENIGTRLVSVSNKVLDGEFGYFVCDENYELHGSAIQSQSKFRLTDNSIDFYFDSSGVSAFIPDSIEIEITLLFDEVFKMVEYPYLNTSKWAVFKAAANFGSFKFNIFTVTGEYTGNETLVLDGFDTGIETDKFKYTIDLNIPNISNPFLSSIQHYNAFVWFSKEIGVVKLEGCAMFVDPITGGRFDIVDSNKVVRHILASAN